jgi:ElaB/YqjD/DUF883 family membrane-anchored ribosome-binding protein
MGGTTSEAGGTGLVEQASSQMQEAASTAQEKASELKERGRGKLRDTLDQRTNEVGGQARRLGETLRESTRHMREQGDGQQVAGMAEGAADRIEQLGGYLEQTSGEEVLRDLERFARRRPWMVAGIGLVAGLAASRFLKASSERRYGSHGTDETGGYRYGDVESASRYADQPVARERYATTG